MTFLPIVERELRVAARRTATYRVRFWAVVVAALLAAGSLLMFEFSQFSPFSTGTEVFSVLAGMAFVFCLAEGIRQTSDCLSGEKREGTLGLLFLTDLRGYDVVLGKLAATSLTSFYNVLAIAPVLSLPLLLGGVMAGEYCRIVLALLNALFLSLCIGIWVSARSREEARTLFGALGIMGALLVGLPLLECVLRADDQWFLTRFSSPLCPFVYAYESHYKFGRGASHYWGSLLTMQLLGWGLLAWACVTIERKWQEDSHTTSWWRTWWEYLWRGSPGHRRQSRLDRLELNPIFWVASRRRAGVLWCAPAIGIPVVYYVWTFSEQSDWMVASWMFSQFAACTFFFLKVIGTWLACHFFLEARRTGSLELMLCTPMPVQAILAGQWLAFRRFWYCCLYLAVLFPAVYLVAIYLHASELDGNTFLMVAFMRIITTSGSIQWDQVIWSALDRSVYLMADIYALFWVGRWLGLTGRSLNHAFFRTYTFVIALPWLAFTMLQFAFMFSSQDPCGLQLGRTIAILIKDALFILWARSRLQADFRLMAATTLTETPLRPLEWLNKLRSRASSVASTVDSQANP